MAASQNGDADAYRVILGIIARRAEQAALAGRMQPGEARAFVADVLTSVHRVRATFDPSRPFATWLDAIIKARMAARTGRSPAARVKALTKLWWTRTAANGLTTI
jgi:hypothetical protein